MWLESEVFWQQLSSEADPHIQVKLLDDFSHDQLEMFYMPTLEILQVWFQTTATKQVSQCNDSHEFFGFLGNIKKLCLAPAGVSQWIERRPVNQRVTVLIPSQGTCLGCGPGPQ